MQLLPGVINCQQKWLFTCQICTVSYELKSQAVANEPNQLTPVSSQTTTPLQPEFTFCHHVLFCAHSKVKSKPIEKAN